MYRSKLQPILLSAVLEMHLDLQEEDNWKPIANHLKNSLYMDNCLTSVGDCEEYEQFTMVKTDLMVEAKKDLRQWECTSQSHNKYN